ncbi:MAG: hypothetical protein ABL921_29110 [Pirellula sp.]
MTPQRFDDLPSARPKLCDRPDPSGPDHSDRPKECEAVVVVDPPLQGEVNMAIDEQLLQAIRPDWPVVVRIYRWQEPTLSIGRFQNDADRQAIPELASLPMVRRKTGGGAIVHDQELTYSVLVPLRDQTIQKGHSELLYRAIHQSVLNQLAHLGWDAKLAESCACANAKKEKKDPFLCFLRRTPVDLLVGEHKILGSAQRRTAVGLLQHGSFLIRNSLSTPYLPGLLDIPSRTKLALERHYLPEMNHSLRFSDNGLGNGTAFDAFLREDSENTHPSHLDWLGWTTFLVKVLKQGLENVVDCNWLDRVPRFVLNSVDPWRKESTVEN